ncbi:MAG: beta-propeller fold lactonase family protein [Acidobacteria bacterium]|nr:beta-propeller fold lactonase family protein [Acidobacteriota bacterium]
MNYLKSIGKIAGTCAVLGLGWYLTTRGAQSQSAPPPVLSRFAGPTSSQTLALDGNGTWLVVANPDNNSVTFFDVANDRNRKLREIPVGEEPNGVAVNPQGTRAYVANTVSGTISVLSILRTSPQVAREIAEIEVGVEPYGVALTPNGRKLYVTNRRSNSVSVIDTATNRVTATITDVGFAPTGIAISNNGNDSDDDETVYVTNFFGTPRTGQLDGEDDAKQGVVVFIRAGSDSVDGVAPLLPIGDTGFKAPGDAIARIAPGTEDRLTTSAYPNQLNSIALKGNFALIPSTGASPNGPARFDLNTQSLLSSLDLTQLKDQTINMHVAVRDQAATPKLFITQPWAVAVKNNANEAYVVSMASDIVVKATLDATGKPSVVNIPGATPTRVLQIATGRNPRGIVINNTDTRAYVMNYISRDVTVIDVTNDSVVGTIESAPLPTPGSFEDQILAGKDLYHASVGEFDGPGPLSPKIRGRMSNNGWGSCSSCHPDGLSDNVVWIFAAGPRRAISQHADFDPEDPTSMRALNWSGIFDEQEDFEANIRGVSGGLGLIVGDDGITPAAAPVPFTPPNGGRRQLKIRGFNAWDAIKAYIQFGVRAPLAPVAKDDPEAVAGRELFKAANCQSCHGGNAWSTSKVTFTPPPDSNLLSAGQIIGQLKKVGTFDSTQRNEVRANAAAPLGADGYVPPSLLSISAFPQTFFHNGSVNSLEGVLNNVAHRSAGTNGVDSLSDSNARRQVVQFLLSIDAYSEPIAPR